MMNIRTARKIGDDVGNVDLTDQERRQAFWRLEAQRNKPGWPEDRKRAQAIWSYFGSRAVKGKEIQ